MGDVFIWRLFNQVAIKPGGLGRAGATRAWSRARSTTTCPQVLDYLESELPADGFLFGALSIADIAIATLLPQRRLRALHASTRRAGRAPRASSTRVLATPPFAEARASSRTA